VREKLLDFKRRLLLLRAQIDACLITLEADIPALPERVNSITAEVCAKHGVTLPQIMAKGRGQDVMQARHECWYLVRKRVVINGATVSSTQIGAWFNRDHATILSGIKAHRARLARGQGAYEDRHHRAKGWT
jgi:chromosomal replication initiation ATPase DnaA